MSKNVCVKCPGSHPVPPDAAGGIHAGCKRTVTDGHIALGKPHPNLSRLEVRISDYEKTVKSLGGPATANYHRPGSMNRKKSIRISDRQRANKGR